jgi:hypothetical protein
VFSISNIRRRSQSVVLTSLGLIYCFLRVDINPNLFILITSIVAKEKTVSKSKAIPVTGHGGL